MRRTVMVQPTLELVEHEAVSARLPGTALEFLLTEHRGHVDVAPRFDGTVTLKARHHVGTIVAPGITLRIRPKCSTRGLFYMLSIAYPLARVDRGTVDYSEADDLWDFIVALFARRLVEFVTRDLRRGYQVREDDLPFVRGKVRHAELLRAPQRWSTSTPCEFEDFTPDTFDNRVLRYAVEVLLHHPRVGAASRPDLRRARGWLEGVATVHVSGVALARARYDRLNETYRPLHQLAALLLDGMGLGQEQGRFQAGTFLVDMNALFELFVAEWLSNRLSPALSVHTQVHTFLDRDSLVTIRPDIVIRPEGVLRLIIDTKYKAGFESNADVYQALAYCRALRVEHAVLLYPVGETCRAVHVVDVAGESL
jgi:5-methylcytosine-specific restriction enzyme subunit McrC